MAPEPLTPIYVNSTKTILNPRYIRRLTIQADDIPNPGERHRLVAEDDQGTIWLLTDWSRDFSEIIRLQHLYARHWDRSHA